MPGLLFLAALGCADQLTLEEAEIAVAEVMVAAKGESTADLLIVPSSQFDSTLSTKQAAGSLKLGWSEAADCLDITRDGDTLVEVDFGFGCKLDDVMFKGAMLLEPVSTEFVDMELEFSFVDLKNRKLLHRTDGVVNWADGDDHRSIETWFAWEDSDGVVRTGSSERTLRMLGEDFRVDGERSWIRDGGAWNVVFDDVIIDQEGSPISGDIVLTNPDGKILEMYVEEGEGEYTNVRVSGLRIGDTEVKVDGDGDVSLN